MHESMDRVISTLNQLIESCRDSEAGVRAAAEAVDRGAARDGLLRLAAERRDLRVELQSEVRRFGGEPRAGGSVAGAVRRAWIGLRSAAAGGGPPAVLAAAAAGEDSAIRAYRQALEDPGMPGDLRMLIERHHARVREARERIRALSDRGRAA